MSTIYKYPIPIEGEFTLHLPLGSDIVAVQIQYEQPCLWARVEPDKPSFPRYFRIFGTGHPMPDCPMKYIGTFQMHGGSLVFHLFEDEP